MLNQILRPIARCAIQRGTQNRLAHQHHHFKYVTFEEACVPGGSWQEANAKRQQKYNIQLVVGLTALVTTIVTINRCELLFFNYLPPQPKE